MDKKVCSILKISESPLFDDGNNVSIKRHKHEIEEYSNILEEAIKKGIAFVIEGSEPTEEELIKIKAILEKKGTVKVFRKRKKIRGKYSIKPSTFHTIAVSKINQDEANIIKENACKYIDKLIGDDCDN